MSNLNLWLGVGGCLLNWVRRVHIFKFGRLYEYGKSQAHTSASSEGAVGCDGGLDGGVCVCSGCSGWQVARNEELQKELTHTRFKLDRMDSALTQHYVHPEANPFKEARRSQETDWNPDVPVSERAEKFRSARIIHDADEKRAHAIAVTAQQLLPGLLPHQSIITIYGQYS